MKRFVSVLLLIGLILFQAAGKSTADNVVIAILASPDSLDPQGSTMLYANLVTKNINGFLFEYNGENKLVPSIAESYTVSADSTVYTIKLKKGVLFHNGDELKAGDVVYTLERGKAHVFKPKNYSLVKKAAALGDYEVQITLAAPYASFAGVLATPAFGILSKKSTESLGAQFARAPVGCGPYKFISWTDGENIKLQAFDKYFQGAPSIKNAVMRFIPDQNTALISLETGEIDYSYVFPESAKPDIKANKKLALHYFDSTSFHFITLNHKVKALSSKKVRQAINFAINRNDIITIAMEGEGKVAFIPVNTNTFGYQQVKGYDYDVAKAKALMKEAGYENGFKVKLIAQDPMTKKIAEVTAANLADIGITVEVEVQETNTAVSNFMKGNYEMGVLAINNAQMDADFIKVLYEPDGTLNLAKYNNKELYDLFTKAGQLSDADKRLKLYKQIFDITIDEAIYVPLFFPNRAHASDSKLDISYIGGSSIAEIFNMRWK